ncbi:MAG: type II secretion system F family protein [Phycisphaerales bacterium]|nr:type II secretion system F family protein [Phycisphaerales bacterium]
MPTWAYEARSRDGTLVKGVLQGPTREVVLAELDRLELAPVRIRESISKTARTPTGVLAGSLRQLSDLIRAGVPLLRALRLLGRGKAHAGMARIWSEIADTVADGSSLADAMAAHPSAFGDVHTAMVRAGEQGGFLEEVLSRLSELLEAQAAMRGRVIGSLIYPAILVLTGVGAVLYALIAFVPKFKPFFERIEVPLATDILLGLSDAAVRFWPVLLLLFVGCAVSWVVAWRRPAPRRWLQIQVLRIPLVGALLDDVALSRSAGILGSLLSNGVGLLRALEISRETAGHPHLAAALESARTAVQGGQRLGQSLGETSQVPEDVVEMIDVAETSNRLPDVLTEVAQVTRKRVDRKLEIMLRLLEPALLVMVAAMVIFIFAALVLPMMRMSSGLQ